MSSNDSNDKNVLERTKRKSNVVKSLVSHMADIKNNFEYVAYSIAPVAKQITKVSTVVIQQDKS